MHETVRRWRSSMRAAVRAVALAAAGAVLLVGCTSEQAEPGSGASSPSSSPSSPTERAETPSSTPSESPPSETAEAEEPPAPRPPPVSVPGLAEQRQRGHQLRIGAVRERTAAYTSYDVTYRSTSETRRGTESYDISGVLNVPTGPGPFPAVVLAHGYIDP